MNWKTRVTIIGGVSGLLIGLASAMLYIRTIEMEQGSNSRIILPALNPSDMIPVLITAIGLVRTVAGMGTLQKPEKKR